MNMSAGRVDHDLREALYNEKAVGPAHAIQVPAERITTLHGFVFDLDPKLYAVGNPLFPPGDGPRSFYDAVRPVLERHPLARFAEVRMTGTGLHLLVRLTPARELLSAADQERWGCMVRAAQCSLPVDRQATGVATLTRPLGSVNGKNGATVEAFKEGEPVAPRAVEDYVTRLAEAPFKVVALALLGGLRVSPCPVCGGAGTRLDVLDHVGQCYNGCGKVTLERLYDRVFRPEGPAAEGRFSAGAAALRPPERRRKGKAAAKAA